MTNYEINRKISALRGDNSIVRSAGLTVMFAGAVAAVVASITFDQHHMAAAAVLFAGGLAVTLVGAEMDDGMDTEADKNQYRWPTPSYDLPDVVYECAGCGRGVSPKHGDKQAALLIAGATTKVCEACARDLQEKIETEDAK